MTRLAAAASGVIVVAFFDVGEAVFRPNNLPALLGSNLEATPLVASPAMATPSIGTPVASEILSVDIRDDDYEPGGLRVAVGERVRWVNQDGVTHTVSANDDTFDSGPMHRGDAFTHTFVEPGTYNYSCDPCLKMSGAVVVRER